MTSSMIDRNRDPEEIELSVVIPCLNEADTLAECVRTAQTAIRENRIAGEVIVADNGSDDGSVEIAVKLGAHLVHVPAKGYGNALMGGIAAARVSSSSWVTLTVAMIFWRFPGSWKSCAKGTTWYRDAVCRRAVAR